MVQLRLHGQAGRGHGGWQAVGHATVGGDTQSTAGSAVVLRAPTHTARPVDARRPEAGSQRSQPPHVRAAPPPPTPREPRQLCPTRPRRPHASCSCAAAAAAVAGAEACWSATDGRRTPAKFGRATHARPCTTPEKAFSAVEWRGGWECHRSHVPSQFVECAGYIWPRRPTGGPLSERLVRRDADWHVTVFLKG